MSLLPALFKARKRGDDAASPPEPAGDSRETDSPPRAAEDNVFELVPPEKIHEAYRVAQSESEPDAPAKEASPKEASPKKGRNIHPLATADLSRLSIDDDGRLYWDGKPVEVRRRIEMSRAQVVGASVVAAFVALGAVGAVIQGSLALRDWGCRLGWTANYCGLPAPARPPRPDIPA
jgi:hypothetical protein